MNIYSSLRTAIRNTALVALNQYAQPTVIFTHQNGSEPEGSYVTISVLGIEQQGHHTTSTQVDSESNLTVQAFYEVLCQFSFVGSASGDMAYSFNHRLNNNPTSLEEASRNKIGVMRKSRVRRVPQMRDTQWVEYHNMDVTFSYNVVTDQPIDIIEGITLQGFYETLSGVVIEDNFTIPADLIIIP